MSEPDWKRKQLTDKEKMDIRVRQANTPAKKVAAVAKFVATGKRK